MSTRQLDVGPGFVRAKECPDCGHTKCGEDCVCNCDAARAEHEAAALRAELARVRAETWREACLHIGNLVEQMTDQQRTAARRLLTVKVNDTRRDELRALGTWIRAHATLSPPEPAAVDGAKTTPVAARRRCDTCGELRWCLEDAEGITWSCDECRVNDDAAKPERGATERACANCGESPCVQLNDCGGTGRAR